VQAGALLDGYSLRDMLPHDEDIDLDIHNWSSVVAVVVMMGWFMLELDLSMPQANRAGVRFKVSLHQKKFDVATNLLQ
jgi:hypothetical protein